MAKIFARTVVKNGNNRQKPQYTKVHRNTEVGLITAHQHNTVTKLLARCQSLQCTGSVGRPYIRHTYVTTMWPHQGQDFFLRPQPRPELVRPRPSHPRQDLRELSIPQVSLRPMPGFEDNKTEWPKHQKLLLLPVHFSVPAKCCSMTGFQTFHTITT